MHSHPDGTVVPCAAGGSLMIVPDICLPAMHAMKDKYGSTIWGKYGFADALNPLTGWVSPDTLGLNVGHDTALDRKPALRQFVEVVHGNSEPRQAMQLAGIVKS